MSIEPVDALDSWCVFLSVFALLVLSLLIHYAMGCPLPVGDIPQWIFKALQPCSRGAASTLQVNSG
jgi:hypothetical protein